jgi:hypothetical protein
MADSCAFGGERVAAIDDPTAQHNRLNKNLRARSIVRPKRSASFSPH